MRSADYAISQFRFLQRLLFVHGRYGYNRVSKMICYYFYKNVILVFCEIYFAFYNGFSGQIYYVDWLPMLYNAVWTSWPCMFTYIFERDADYDTSLKHPVLYEAGPKKVYFNYGVFWKYIVFALFHGMVCFHFVVYGLEGPFQASGKTQSSWCHSTISFTLIIHIVTYKLLLESTMWNAINL